MLVIVAKVFLKLPNLYILSKQTVPSVPRNLAFGTFGKLLIFFSIKVNLLYIPPLFSGPEVLFSASDKAKLFAKYVSKNSNLYDSGTSWPVFPSRTNLKLHNISVTSKMVKKVITNHYISEVILKNCEPEFSYVLGELFNMCLKESGFPDFIVGPSI